MSKYMWRPAAPMALATLLAVAACSGEKKADTLAQDSSLAADMQLANRDTTSQPQLSDVPAATPAPAPSAAAPARTPSRATTAPRTTTPRTTTPAPTRTTTPSGNTVTRTGTTESATGTIPAGTTLDLSSTSRVCTNTNKVGDRVTATVRNAVSGSNGAVIPAGATATLEVTSLKRSENANDKINVGFRVVSLTFGGRTYPVSASVASADVERVKNQPKGKDAQKVATGAAVGAVIGQVLGKNTKSTVIGGAIGAAAGAGAAAATSNYEGCVPAGGRISVTLNEAAQVHI